MHNHYKISKVKILASHKVLILNSLEGFRTKKKNWRVNHLNHKDIILSNLVNVRSKNKNQPVLHFDLNHLKEIKFLIVKATNLHLRILCQTNLTVMMIVQAMKQSHKSMKAFYKV